ncbi:glycerophosphodiester phosphodiesterase [Microtetraspora glauca]|uniref:Glycerophosphodiester phosphodiesterase family protein n=1 Tax=Microtetraspora glauca TaxID=1996 RepID=A0ABV3GP07_MICGL
MPNRPLIIAHRGNSLLAPEQTMAAYRAAAELGADMIEADVRRSRDGVLLLMHDETLDRTTTGAGPVADFTWAELSELDAGGWFGQDYAGERVPCLDELLDFAEEADISLCLEAKGATPREQRFVASAVAQELARRGRLDRDVVASFDHEALAEAARATPGLRLAPDRLPERGPSRAETLIAQARRIGAEIIQHHHADLAPAAVKATQEAGIAIWAWPATSEESIERVHVMSVAGLMGDDVAAMVRVVDRSLT